MENIYFKGLEKSLNDGCYIKVFSCSLRYPVVRVEKKSQETNEVELVSNAENGNVIAALNSASSKIIDELSDEDKTYETLWCKRTLIDKVVEQGYTLHFFKLSNGQVLSTICCNRCGDYIPVKSIIADDIKTAFETLNAALQSFNFESKYDFHNFVEREVSPVEAYKKTLRKEKTKTK